MTAKSEKPREKWHYFFSKSNIWKVNFSNKQKIVSLRDTHTYTRAYARAFPQRCCFFAVTSVTQPMLKRRKTLSSNSNHTAKQRLVLPKTTCHFIKNNVSFYQKRRVVFQRMSALNDTQVAHQWKTAERRIVSQQCPKNSANNQQRGTKILIFHTFREIRHL